MAVYFKSRFVCEQPVNSVIQIFFRNNFPTKYLKKYRKLLQGTSFNPLSASVALRATLALNGLIKVLCQ